MGVVQIYLFMQENKLPIWSIQEKGRKEKKKGEMWNLLMGERKFRWEA